MWHYEPSAIASPQLSLWTEVNVPHWRMDRLYDAGFLFPLPYPPDMTIMQATVANIHRWSANAGGMYRAVVTTKAPYHDEVYTTLAAEAGEVQITPGLKLWEYIDHVEYIQHPWDFLSDAGVWEDFTRDAMRCAELTGSNRIVIMAEGPMHAFYGGHLTFNAASMVAGLAALRESNLIPIWYPFGTYAGRRLSHGEYLVRSMQDACPNSVFPSVGTGKPPRLYNDPADEALRERAMIAAANNAVIAHVHVCHNEQGNRYVWSRPHDRDPQPYWTWGELRWWLKEATYHEVWVYPGMYSDGTTADAMPEVFEGLEV